MGFPSGPSTAAAPRTSRSGRARRTSASACRRGACARSTSTSPTPAQAIHGLERDLHARAAGAPVARQLVQVPAWPSRCRATSPSANSRPRTASSSSSRPASSSSRWAPTLSGVRYEWDSGLPDAFPVLSRPKLFDALWQRSGRNFAHRRVGDIQLRQRQRPEARRRGGQRCGRAVPAEHQPGQAGGARRAHAHHVPFRARTHERIQRERHHLLPGAHGRLCEWPLPVPARALRTPQRPGVPRCHQLRPREPRQRIQRHRRCSWNSICAGGSWRGTASCRGC
jgi:hypothetical protein